MASVDVSKPATSLKCASLMPPISSRNRKFLKGSRLMFRLLPFLPGRSQLDRRRAARELRDPEDYKLRGTDRRHADHDDQPPVVDVVVGHGAAVHFHEERFLFGRAQ